MRASLHPLGKRQHAAAVVHSLNYCVDRSAPLPPPQTPVARLVLEPASAATCSAAALPAECAAQLTAAVNGSAVSLEPLGPACAAATGIVTGPNGHSAAVAFPRSPVGVVASGLDGFVTIEFGRGHEGDAANRAWSGCSLRYRVVQGSFLGATEIPAAVEAGVATRQQQEQHALALLQQQHPHHPAAGQVRQRDAGGVSAVEAPRWGAAPMRMGMPGAAGIASFRAASISGAAFHPPVN
jgi:hypothetical protein